MVWQRFTATGGLASIFGLALLLGSGCTGNAGAVNFDPIAGSSGDGASGGSKPSGAGGKSGSAGDGNDAAAAGSGTGGSGNGGSAGSGSDAGGSGAADNGGEGGTSAGGSNQGGSGGSDAGSGGTGGSGGSGGGANEGCTSASFGGHDYTFCGAVASGNDAFALCESLGMVAVSIESKAENDFLIGQLTGSSWIGATDEDHEGVWHWPNDVEFWDQTEDNKGPIPGQYQNWQEGQPNNANGDGLDENCAALEISADAEGTWNDLACDLETELRATCESAGPVIGPFPF